MSAKALFSRGWLTRLGFYLGRYLIPGVGRYIAATVARSIVMLKPDLYWAARSNLRHVLDPQVREAEFRRKLYVLFSNAGRGYYELFHNVGRGELDVHKFRPPVYLTPEAKTYLHQGLEAGRGLMLLGAHLSNFDLAWIGLAQYIPVEMQALSLADPPPGFEFFNHLREQDNVLLTPISPPALREAMRRLRAGGLVLTGADRPIGEGDAPVTFFGATAHLPTGYIRIPLRTDCLVMTVAAYYEDGAYWVTAHPPMAMQRTGDAAQDVTLNVHRVLGEIEDFIRRYPEQWMMFVPVWRSSE